MQYGEIIDGYYDMILGVWENGFTLALSRALHPSFFLTVASLLRRRRVRRNETGARLHSVLKCNFPL
jgi:hypothetical protein